MVELIPVPEVVTRTAAAALAERAQRGSGATARSLVIATALTTGYVRASELGELREWHDEHPDAVQGEDSTLLAGLYGGAAAREWDCDLPVPVEAEPRLVDVELLDTPAPATAAVDAVQPLDLSGILRSKLAKLATQVNQTDRTLLTKLHSAAEVAYRQALQAAAGKLMARARSKAAKAAAISVVDGGGWSDAVLAAVGVTEQELLDRRFDALGVSALAWIAAAERRKLTAAARALGLDRSELEDRYGDEIDRRAEAAAGLLIASLGILARNALSGSEVTAETSRGEFGGPVPFRIVRSAFDVGTRGARPPDLSEPGVGPADTGLLSLRPQAEGQSLTDQILGRDADAGPLQKVYTWQVGEPERPFEPHQALDGATYTEDERDQVLAADPGEWPYVDIYEVSDHIGCECQETVDWQPVEFGDAPTLETADVSG